MSVECLHRRIDRRTAHPFPCKRKLEEFSPAVIPGDGVFSISTRRRSSMEAEDDTASSSGSSLIQFFVRYSSKTIVMTALREDRVETVQDRLMKLTGIPISEQRLILNGRHLYLDRTLLECGVQKDSCLQMTGRLRSTKRPGSWMVANDIVSAAYNLRTKQYAPKSSIRIDSLVRIFLNMTPISDTEQAKNHLGVFLASGAPQALAYLYISCPYGNCKLLAHSAIHLFVDYVSIEKQIQFLCFPIVLEFCKLLLQGVGNKDTLYIIIRKNLSFCLTRKDFLESSFFDFHRVQTFIQEIILFVHELADTLSDNLSTWTMEGLPPANAFRLSEPLDELLNFLTPLQNQWDKLGCFPIPPSSGSSQSSCSDWFEMMHHIFLDLFEACNRCLFTVADILKPPEEILDETALVELTNLLTLLTLLDDLSKIFKDAKEMLHSLLLEHKVPLNRLYRRAKRIHNLWWVLEHRDVVDFESRKHLVLLMFPNDADTYDDEQEMLINRSSIMSESFEYIISTEPHFLQGGLLVEFKNEEATGPGVVREWFCLLCREIFNQSNILFLPCPNDRQRFFPNPASTQDPLHEDYFVFCGRFVALALMNGVQLGITFDRTFFLNLSGMDVSLEDVQDTDPFLYSSCKKILDMDEELLDSDVLGLTFVREAEYMESRKMMELCEGGKNLVVNSRNRQKYIDLMIEHCFVTSISKLADYFLRGFSDILSDHKLGQRFFRSLNLDDLDRMLGGHNGTICITDWKKHIEYKGYNASDDIILWFWKVIEWMSPDQRRSLLYFWTSVKFLPAEGFGGLDSKLYVFQSTLSTDHLPTSHTCFYRIHLPLYTSLTMTKQRLLLLTQEHVGCSFGVP